MKSGVGDFSGESCGEVEVSISSDFDPGENGTKPTFARNE